MQPPPNIKLNVSLAFKETDFNEKFSVATFPVEYFIMKVSQEKKKNFLLKWSQHRKRQTYQLFVLPKRLQIKSVSARFKKKIPSDRQTKTIKSHPQNWFYAALLVELLCTDLNTSSSYTMCSSSVLCCLVTFI